MRKFLYTALLFSTALLFNSCSTMPPITMPVEPTPQKTKTVIHTVAPAETFWRISKMYNVPVSTIIQTNHMKSSDKLKMGQKLVIPQASPLKPVVSLYPSRKWKYIIIHHSATDKGNSLAVHKMHLKKGWDKGVGYHFVIDNGTSGKQDGQIEMSPRWIKQEDGAHCKASGMNAKAIGICLIGNFNNERVSREQMESLVYLTNKLRRYYHIPVRRIIPHGQVDGAATECPGKHFPWKKFLDKLKGQGY